MNENGLVRVEVMKKIRDIMNLR